MSEMIVHNRPDIEIGSPTRSGVTYTPRFDVWEDDNEFVLSGDLPGATPDGLDIRFNNRELTIWCRVAPRHSGVNFWAQEYGVVDYYRSFTVGEMVNPDAITAELKDGVLTIHLPKKEEARPRKIAIKAT